MMLTAMEILLLVAVCLLNTSSCCGGFHPTPPPLYQSLPSLKDQAAIQDAWTTERITRIPILLKKYDVDAWLISQREHAEDTLFWSMKSATQFAARRRTIQLFVQDAPYTYTWVDNTEGIWVYLRDALKRHQPQTIAVNINSDIVFGGGLHAGEWEALIQNLGIEWPGSLKIKDEPMLGVEYVAHRVDGQLDWYRRMQETAWAMVSEAFSERIVVPGVTTTHDLSWWFREKIQHLNYSTWNMPRVSVVQPSTFPGNDLPTRQVIEIGDMLHVDFGVTALGLNTDTQHLGYDLGPGQTGEDVPKEFIEGLKKSNRMQEIVRTTMRPGVSGNQILKESLELMKSEGIEGRIYCHPIGDWDHSAGSLIGMTNLQDSVPVLGDLPLLPNTFYSIELYAEHFVPERNASLKFMQEENVYWNETTGHWEYVFGRQELFHLVKARARASLLTQL